MANAKSRTKKKSAVSPSSEGLLTWLGEYSQATLKYTPATLAPRFIWSILLWVGLPIILGLWLAGLAIKQPAVGIINLDTGISTFTAEFLALQIEEARKDPSIKAVVLEINTPGGSVVPTQDLYFELLDLREDMPVVSAIDSLAASGGYYLAMATDPIFAKPSSTVGNIGVWGYIPPDLAVNDLILASGPFKLTASNQAEFVREIEGIKREFLETVKAGRGDRLQMEDHEVLTGLAYPGREALELGLIDHIGSTNEAIAKAAEMAGLKNYRVIDLEKRLLEEVLGISNPFFENIEEWVYSKNPLSDGFILPPGAYLLYDMQLGGLP